MKLTEKEVESLKRMCSRLEDVSRILQKEVYSNEHGDIKITAGAIKRIGLKVANSVKTLTAICLKPEEI